MLIYFTPSTIYILVFDVQFIGDIYEITKNEIP